MKKLILLIVSILISYLCFYVFLAFKYNFNPSCLFGLYQSDYEKNKEIIPSKVIVYKEGGYGDGGCYYIVTLDIKGERSSIKWDSKYRSERILLPFFIHLLSFGNKKIIPYIFPVFNVFMIITSTIFLFFILKNQTQNFLLSFAYSINPGFLLAFKYNLAEILSIGLIVIGIYFLLNKNPWYILFFCLCVFAKSHIGVFFILSCGLSHLISKDYKNLLKTLMSLIPYLVYQILLFFKTGKISFFYQFHLEPLKSPTGGNIDLIPFFGMVEYFLNIEKRQTILSQLYELGVIPFIIFVLFCLFVSFYSLRKNILNILFFTFSLYCSFCACEGWSTVGQSGRFFVPLYTLFILTSPFIKGGKIKKFGIIFLIFLSLLIFIRAITLPKFPTFITK